MPLDPQAEALLKEFEEAGAPPFHSLTPAEGRVAAQGFKDLGGPPEDVSKVDYRFIPGPTADLPALIYYPADAPETPLPCVVYFHGSGWVIGNIANCDSFNRALANRSGCVVVAVNYQKAPEHKFPIPLDDCYAATEWVFDNADELGIDADRIGVLGDSAGGNIAAAVTLLARDTAGPNIAFQVLVYPALQYGWDSPSSINYAEGYLLERETMKYFWNHYVNNPTDGVNPYCSPLLAEDFSDLPPAFIVCAKYDPLFDDGEEYAKKLEAAGVPAEFKVYDGMIHGFLWFQGVLDQSKEVVDEIGVKLQQALK